MPSSNCIVCDCKLPKSKYGDEVIMPTYHKKCAKYAKLLLNPIFLDREQMSAYYNLHFN
jgi:hypothetical protein